MHCRPPPQSIVILERSEGSAFRFCFLFVIPQGSASVLAVACFAVVHLRNHPHRPKALSSSRSEGSAFCLCFLPPTNFRHPERSRSQHRRDLRSRRTPKEPNLPEH